MDADHPPRLTPEMSSFRALVLAFVGGYLSANRVSPSQGEIAAAMNVSRDRVRKAIASLSADGLLIYVPGPRGLSLPSLRAEAIRQLRACGYVVDEDIGRAHLPPPNCPLQVAPELTYPTADGERDEAA